MNVEQLTATAKPITDVLAILQEGDRRPTDDETTAAGGAVIAIFIDFFANVSRIAEAAEQISMNTQNRVG